MDYSDIYEVDEMDFLPDGETHTMIRREGGTSYGVPVGGGLTLDVIRSDNAPPRPRAEDEFPDIRRDVQTMSPRFFQALDNSRLSPQQKLMMQRQYFSGMDETAMQREKLRQAQNQSMIQELNIRKAQESLAGFRRSQMAAQRSSEVLRGLSEQIRQIGMADADPVAKATALDALRMENIDMATDPAINRMFEAARKTLTGPITDQVKSEYSQKELGELHAKGVPPEILASGNDYLISAWATARNEEFAKQKARQEGDTRRLFELNKARRTRIGSLIQEPFRFMTLDERNQERAERGYARIDNLQGRVPYLTTDSRQRAEKLLYEIGAGSEIPAFRELTDEEKLEFIQNPENGLMARAYQFMVDKLSEDEERLTEYLRDPERARVSDAADELGS